MISLSVQIDQIYLKGAQKIEWRQFYKMDNTRINIKKEQITTNYYGRYIFGQKQKEGKNQADRLFIYI